MVDVQKIKEQVEKLELDFQKVEINQDGSINYYGCVTVFSILDMQEDTNINLTFKHIDSIYIDGVDIEDLHGLENLEIVNDIRIYSSSIKTTEHLTSLKTVKGIIKIYECPHIINVDNLKKFKNLEVLGCDKLGFTRYPLMKRFKTSMFYQRVFLETGLVNIFKNKKELKYGRNRT